MANRSYLYATDTVPGQEPAGATAERVGLSEWPYVIPLTHAILVSVDTAQCPSTIWEGERAVAFVGDYEGGLARLKVFLGQVAAPAAQPLIREAVAFLELAANRRKYILLEVQEIFEMDDDPEAQGTIFAAGLASLDDDIALELAGLPPVPERSARFPRALVRTGGPCSLAGRCRCGRNGGGVGFGGVVQSPLLLIFSCCCTGRMCRPVRPGTRCSAVRRRSARISSGQAARPAAVR